MKKKYDFLTAISIVLLLVIYASFSLGWYEKQPVRQVRRLLLDSASTDSIFLSTEQYQRMDGFLLLHFWQDDSAATGTDLDSVYFWMRAASYQTTSNTAIWTLQGDSIPLSPDRGFAFDDTTINSQTLCVNTAFSNAADETDEHMLDWICLYAVNRSGATADSGHVFVQSTVR